MCQVQIMIPINRKVNEKDVNEFFEMLELGSYGNKDAYGLFTNKYMYRKGTAFYNEKESDKEKIAKTILDNNPKFLIGHNRLSTKGSENINHNNHPFPTNDWVIVHNGVIRNDVSLKAEFGVEYEEDTDSVIIVNLLQLFYEQTGDAVEAIKQCAENLEGSFSICAYNKTEKRLFYFKNKSTSFSWRLIRFKDGDEILLGSTDSDNFDYIFNKNYMIFNLPSYDTAFDLEASSEKIYELSNKKISIVSSFKEKEWSYASTANHSTRYSGNHSKKKHYNTTGGFYDNDWGDYDSEWSNGKDVDYSHPSHAFAGLIEHADTRFNMEASAEDLYEDMNEALGIDFNYDIKVNEGKVIYTFNDSPVSMNDIVTTLRDRNVCQCEIHSTNSISVKIKELYDLYK